MKLDFLCVIYIFLYLCIHMHVSIYFIHVYVS